MERDGMLRHLAFFGELGRMDETDASWRSVSAGLVVMRLVDQWIADGPTASRVDSWGVSAVREAIAQIAETTPIKRILTSAVDVMTSATAMDLHALCPRLMAYGQALEYEAKWALAADVYTTIVAHAHPAEDSDLAIAAHLQLAFCLRTIGDLDAAVRAYAEASRVSFAAGDLIGMIRGRIGDAKIAIARGNLPEAAAILDQAIETATASGSDEIQSRALHERAYLAGMSGRHERAIEFGYRALGFSPAPRQRDRILINIATAFRYLGLCDVARDAYLVLAATSQEQYVRWTAELNLMEIAAIQGAELQFDKYRRELESADFEPLLRVTYLLHVGRGYHSLGQAQVGIPYLERAIELASANNLNQLLFESEEALAEAHRRIRRRAVQAADVDAGVQTVVDAVRQMKTLAGII